MEKQRQQTKHNAETIRLAKKLPFTARDLNTNQQGKLSEKQISDIGRNLWRALAINIGLLIFVVVIDVLLLTGVLDLTTLLDSRRVVGVAHIALVFGNLVLIWFAIKFSMAIWGLKKGNIQIFKGQVKYSTRKASGQTMFYLHLGDLKWHIDYKYYNLFQEGYEYTIYYLTHAEVILSVNASDPRFRTA